MSVCECGATGEDDHEDACSLFLLAGCFFCKAPEIKRRSTVARASFVASAYARARAERDALLTNMEDRGSLASICDDLCPLHRGAVIAVVMQAAWEGIP